MISYRRMKPFLVDVPVKLNIWIRPEYQIKQFEIIKKTRPSILFLISDHGRNLQERELVEKNRKIFEEIDWECQIYKLFEDVNQGMYEMIGKTHELIWKHVDRCIFLEDDILPSVSYFRYCAELLERYKNDTRINVICGMNHLGVYEDVDSDYFFSRQGSIWGCAMWKRTYDQYYDFSYCKDKYILKLLNERTKHNKIFQKRLNTYAQSNICEGHEAGDEFFLEFSIYGQNQLQIVPKKNMIRNIGTGKNSAHSDEIYNIPHGIRRIFEMSTYEVDFPLNHPSHVIPDIFYEKKRNQIMAYNCPFRYRWRQLEIILLKLMHGEFKEISILIKKKVLKRKQKIER